MWICYQLVSDFLAILSCVHKSWEINEIDLLIFKIHRSEKDKHRVQKGGAGGTHRSMLYPAS